MSIITQRINPRPRLTNFLVSKDVFRNAPLCVIDVGARGGFEEHWDCLYGDQANLIGFEVDTKECEKINIKSKKNHRYYPVGLSDKKGSRAFYVQPHIASSSFYETRRDFIDRFPASYDLIPKMTVEVSTLDLDSFVADNGLAPDFLKLDIEGAELDVFRGGRKCLSGSVFGVSAEAVFYPWREGMPTFADIDSFLRALGFMLYDLPVFRWEKKTLSPYMYEDEGVFGPTDRGQVIWTQAVYLKDSVAELTQNKTALWPPIRILKMASVMELYNLEDCAIELLQKAVELNLLESYDVSQFIDLATPPLHGKDISYSDYLEHLKKEGPPRFIEGKVVSREEYNAKKRK